MAIADAESSKPESPDVIALMAITQFMQGAGISVRGLRPDPQGIIEQRVREIVKPWDLSGVSPKRFNASLTTGVDIAGSSYPYTSINTQVHIAIFTLLATCFDDFLTDSDAMSEFSDRFRAGLPQRLPLLQYFADSLSSMSTYFLPFAARAIVNSALVYMNRNVFDKEASEMPIHEAARQYIEWKRLQNGMAEAYALFIWDKHSFSSIHSFIQAVPEVVLCVNYMNDILSFYKEELEGDVTNYIHERAKVTGRETNAVLFDVVNDTIEAVKRARDIVQGDAERAAVDAFVAGYTVFHVYSPRYRLLDLMKGSEYL
ncbi:hypothetical protein NM688_g2850 [Phlebia brevispora]|uniref:Uncharacterized protein n=1 Tax=Phlebia brevispora TaxID=194682 RepID=A0ACC1T773_9APHY|nr:hypothetical protein NM688_g2850 [Phlebia brevispora]